MATATIAVGPGTYDVVIDGVAGQVTVPVLTAGSIDQSTAEIGDTLTVSSSNASAQAAYQWQRDGVDISGATQPALDTSGRPEGAYRRAATDGVQGPVYTATVTVSATAATGEIADTFTVASDTEIGSYVGESVQTWTVLRSDTANVAVIDAATGRLRADAEGAAEFAYRGNTEYSNSCYAEAVVRRGSATSGSFQGVHVVTMVSGAVNAENGYMCRYNSGADRFDIFRISDGGFSSLGNFANSGFGFDAEGSTVTVRIEADGTNVVSSINGVVQSTIPDNTHTSGYPGFRGAADSLAVGQYPEFVSFVGGGT